MKSIFHILLLCNLLIAISASESAASDSSASSGEEVFNYAC